MTPVSAIRSVLEDDLYVILRSLRSYPTGRTDDADRIAARLLAKHLWDKGWRKKGER